MHTNIHTFIHTYIHTYIHTVIHINKTNLKDDTLRHGVYIDGALMNVTFMSAPSVWTPCHP